MGEVMVVELDGRARTLTRRIARLAGLAWAPGDREVWFTAGELQRNTLRAVDLEGHQRELYRAPSDIRIDDIASDGSVLLSNQYERSEVAADHEGRQQLLSWGDWTNSLAAFTRDRKVLFSVTDPTPTLEGEQGSLVLLRGVDGEPAQILGTGMAEDLSPDGQWALTISVDGKTLGALPIGPGQPRTFPLKDLIVNRARWSADARSILLVARGPSDPAVHLYALGADDGVLRLVSQESLAGRRILFVSPDGQRVATLDSSWRPLILSLADGRPIPSPALPPDAIPRGWASPGELWITRGGDRAPARARLLRMDVSAGRVLEERDIGPIDPTGSGGIGHVIVSKDGRDMALMFGRTVGQLFVLRGLLAQPR
jgi:hypothetical protein